VAKEKNSSDTPTPKKTATKKVSAKKAPAKKLVVEQVVEKVAAAAATGESQLSAVNGEKAQPSPAELQEAIRRRAYELYRQRGGQHGADKADWHRAEVEVRAKFKV